MNSGLRPIPPDMPLDRAADLMVRRGECSNVFLARARSSYGSTTITDADRAARAHVESPRPYRFPYADE